MKTSPYRQSSLPNCKACDESAYEHGGEVVETHKIGCLLCPIVPFDPDPRATKVVVRYDRAKAKSLIAKL